MYCRLWALEEVVVWHDFVFKYFTEWAWWCFTSIVGVGRESSVYTFPHRPLRGMWLWVNYCCVVFPCDVVYCFCAPPVFAHHKLLCCCLSTSHFDSQAVVVGMVFIIYVHCDWSVEDVGVDGLLRFFSVIMSSAFELRASGNVNCSFFFRFSAWLLIWLIVMFLGIKSFNTITASWSILL